MTTLYTATATSAASCTASGNVTVTVQCLPPTALNATSITASGANLQWTPGGAETAWEYVYGANPLAAPSGSGDATSSSTVNAISGLAGNTSYDFYVRANCGGSFSTWVGPYTFTTPTGSRTLNLTGIQLEGLYAGGGTLNVVNDDFGPVYPAGIADHISVELHSSAAGDYANIIYTAPDVPLTTDATATVSVPAAYSGTYYITIKHRNSMETVSADPKSFATSPVTQSFATLSDVYMGNLAEMFDGGYAIFTGDINQDGYVDSSDQAGIEIDSSVGLTGFQVTDLNGDGYVDSSDQGLVEINSSVGVASSTP